MCHLMQMTYGGDHNFVILLFNITWLWSSLSLNEGNVEQGCIQVHKLEEVHLGDEVIIVLCLKAVVL